MQLNLLGIVKMQTKIFWRKKKLFRELNTPDKALIMQTLKRCKNYFLNY